MLTRCSLSQLWMACTVLSVVLRASAIDSGTIPCHRCHVQDGRGHETSIYSGVSGADKSNFCGWTIQPIFSSPRLKHFSDIPVSHIHTARRTIPPAALPAPCQQQTTVACATLALKCFFSDFAIAHLQNLLVAFGWCSCEPTPINLYRAMAAELDLDFSVVS